MNKLFTDESWADYQYWIDVDKKQLKRINLLIKDIDQNPHSGRQTVAYSRDVMRHFSKNSFGS
jgi:Txe/YoeB family toxin of Txe-Axe toxin-antitoxin module